VQPTLLPDEELADLAAAEEVVTNKENQRAVIVDKLQEELRRESTARRLRKASRPSINRVI